MRSGPLRHLITIQQVSETVDSMGSSTTSWTTYVTAFASISPVKGMEELEHKKLEHDNVYRIWIRYDSGVTAKMRISWNSRIFRIISIRNPEERNRTLELMAEEDVT